MGFYKITIKHPLHKGEFNSWCSTNEDIYATYPAGFELTDRIRMAQMVSDKEQVKEALAAYGCTLVRCESYFWVEHTSFENVMFGAAVCVNDLLQPPFNGFWLGDNSELRLKLFSNGEQVVSLKTYGIYNNHLIMGKFYLLDVNRPLVSIKNHYEVAKLKAALVTSQAAEIAFVNPALALGYLKAATDLDFKEVGKFKPKKIMGIYGRPVYLSWVYECKSDPAPYRVTATFYYGSTDTWEVEFSPISSK
jgi:hypothetical protein